jgi:hypothetical protein
MNPEAEISNLRRGWSVAVEKFIELAKEAIGCASRRILFCGLAQ